MINFDALTLKLFCEENAMFFQGAKIQKIQQPSRSELIFHIRNSGESKKLYVNFNPAFYHICFMSADNQQRRNLTMPQNALMFCMLLRKYIQNAKIIKVEVPEYERIFEIYFEYFDELNEKSQLCLAVELMGKYSNVILYNYETNVIIGCAHNVSSEKSKYRELKGTLPYIYPLKQQKKNLINTDFNYFKNNLDLNNLSKSISENYHYLTSSFVNDIISDLSLSMSDKNDILTFEKKLYNTLISILSKKDFTPCISNNYSKYYVTEMKNCFKCKTVNEMIDEYFSYNQLKSMIRDLKSKTIKNIKSRIEKLDSTKTNQELQIQKADMAKEYKTKADLITANLYSLKSGEKEIKLVNYDGKEIKINLDESKTLAENANKYYQLYKKAKTAQEYALNMIEETKSKIMYFQELKYFAENSQDFNELAEIYNELSEEYKENKKDNEKNETIDFVDYEGIKIFIGKNQKQNDYILSKLSASDDIWFHTLNAPGAHVLVKTNNQKENITPKIILKAAQLTKEFSSQKNNSKTSVIYTKRKYVKKAKNKQAFVTYKNETEIIV